MCDWSSMLLLKGVSYENYDMIKNNKLEEVILIAESTLKLQFSK